MVPEPIVKVLRIFSAERVPSMGAVGTLLIVTGENADGGGESRAPLFYFESPGGP
jgi:hypothetical protein